MTAGPSTALLGYRDSRSTFASCALLASAITASRTSANLKEPDHGN